MKWPPTFLPPPLAPIFSSTPAPQRKWRGTAWPVARRVSAALWILKQAAPQPAGSWNSSLDRTARRSARISLMALVIRTVAAKARPLNAKARSLAKWPPNFAAQTADRRTTPASSFWRVPAKRAAACWARRAIAAMPPARRTKTAHPAPRTAVPAVRAFAGISIAASKRVARPVPRIAAPAGLRRLRPFKESSLKSRRLGKLIGRRKRHLG